MMISESVTANCKEKHVMFIGRAAVLFAWNTTRKSALYAWNNIDN